MTSSTIRPSPTRSASVCFMSPRSFSWKEVPYVKKQRWLIDEGMCVIKTPVSFSVAGRAPPSSGFTCLFQRNLQRKGNPWNRRTQAPATRVPWQLHHQFAGENQRVRDFQTYRTEHDVRMIWWKKFHPFFEDKEIRAVWDDGKSKCGFGCRYYQGFDRQ